MRSPVSAHLRVTPPRYSPASWWPAQAGGCLGGNECLAYRFWLQSGTCHSERLLQMEHCPQFPPKPIGQDSGWERLWADSPTGSANPLRRLKLLPRPLACPIVWAGSWADQPSSPPKLSGRANMPPNFGATCPRPKAWATHWADGPTEIFPTEIIPPKLPPVRPASRREREVKGRRARRAELQGGGPAGADDRSEHAERALDVERPKAILRAVEVTRAPHTLPLVKTMRQFST